MKENEIIWRTLEHKEFEDFRVSIQNKAFNIIENYDLIGDESALSTNQLQALVRTSFVLPGLETKSRILIFDIDQEGSNDLNNCKLPGSMKEKFKEKKILLPNDEDLVINVVAENQEWWLSNGLYIFNIRKENSKLNVYDLEITKFIRHQANKGKANQGYNKLYNNVKLGKTLCSYLWYDAEYRDDLTNKKQDIYNSLTSDMKEKCFPVPAWANPDVIHARLVQEFVGHFVDLILTKRKEQKEGL